MSAVTKAATPGGAPLSTKDRIQVFGRFLSGMVMPNIGAFIAWGLITALFIPTGWTPNENLSKLVGPMITWLLPLLIGYTGGKLAGGVRGGVLGAIATSGVVVGADIPMFLGAMIMGPIGGYCIKKFDEAVHGKVASGFEMLVNNFSAGIIGTLLALAAFLGIGPVVQGIMATLAGGVQVIVNAGLLPLVSLFIEPGKILFMNNAMNHGILGPLGVQQSQELGQSIFFLLETNPGPGLGILLAYWVFGKGMVKQSAPGSVIIHFLGGIHEIYFPYVLMNPMLLLAVIGGGMSGVFTFAILGAGLVATPSPGSIFALMAMTPKGGHFAVLAGVAVATAVSFLIASFFVKASKETGEDSELEEAKAKMKELKGVTKGSVSKIVFACDAGMGSSAMGASTLRNKLKKAGLEIAVSHSSVDEVPLDADLVISHENLTARAKARVPKAEHISIRDFVNNPVYDEIVADLVKHAPRPAAAPAPEAAPEAPGVLRADAILTGLASEDRDSAIRRAGQLLAERGYVDPAYIPGMLAREEVASTYIGSGVAIPHGVNEAKRHVRETGIVILQYPQGVDFGEDNVANLVIGIAAQGEEHIEILSNIAEAIGDEAVMEQVKQTADAAFLYNLFSGIGQERA